MRYFLTMYTFLPDETGHPSAVMAVRSCEGDNTAEEVPQYVIDNNLRLMGVSQIEITENSCKRLVEIIKENKEKGLSK